MNIQSTLSRIGILPHHLSAFAIKPSDGFCVFWDLLYPESQCSFIGYDYAARPEPFLVFRGAILYGQWWCDRGLTQDIIWWPERNKFTAKQSWNDWHSSITEDTNDPTYRKRRDEPSPQPFEGFERFSQIRDLIIEEIPCPEIILRQVEAPPCPDWNKPWFLDSSSSRDFWGFSSKRFKGFTPTKYLETHNIWKEPRKGFDRKFSLIFD